MSREFKAFMAEQAKVAKKRLGNVGDTWKDENNVVHYTKGKIHKVWDAKKFAWKDY